MLPQFSFNNFCVSSVLITLPCFNKIRIVFISTILEYVDSKIVFRLRLSFVLCKRFKVLLCTQVPQ
jgi:hypothetical protein